MAVDVRPEARPAPAPASAFDDLIRAVADRPVRPAAWVDAATYPWAEEDFSSRYVRRANYQTLYGMKETGDEVEDILGMLALAPKARACCSISLPRRKSRSMNTTRLAPRLKASRPLMPVPAKTS